MKKTIVVDNPLGLILVPLGEIKPFQANLKGAISESALAKLAQSILDHHLFIGKAVFYEDGVPYTEDGHQTLKALEALQADGYKRCEVVSYTMKDGRMQESGREAYDQIMIPCQVIVPKGETAEARRKDALRKLLQINSRYAPWGTDGSAFEQFGFGLEDLDKLLSEVEVPGLEDMFFGFAGDEEDEETSFVREFEAESDATCRYPLTPRFSEKYDALIIFSDNEIDTAFLKEVLEIRLEQTYKKSRHHAEGMVITASRFIELWKSRS